MLQTPNRTLGLMPNPATDAELVVRLHRNDETALSELYDRYIHAAYGLCMRVLEDPEAAQEVVQDAFLKLWNRPELYDPARASFAAFFMTLIRNMAIDHLRKRRNESSIYDEEGELLPFSDPGSTLQDRAELQDLGGRLRQGLSQLSAAHQETVERAFFKGESREDIATAMQVPLGTVKSRLKYALDRLRLALKGLRDEL